MNDAVSHPSADRPFVVPMSYVPQRTEDVLELDMGDGLILYNHSGDLVHHLNPTAGLVWQLCDGEASVGQLGKEIAEEYSLEVAAIGDQVATLVAEFDALGLVRDTRAIELKPASKEGGGTDR
jgi:hypothetical protein